MFASEKKKKDLSTTWWHKYCIFQALSCLIGQSSLEFFSEMKHEYKAEPIYFLTSLIKISRLIAKMPNSSTFFSSGPLSVCIISTDKLHTVYYPLICFSLLLFRYSGSLPSPGRLWFLSCVLVIYQLAGLCKNWFNFWISFNNNQWEDGEWNKE